MILPDAVVPEGGRRADHQGSGVMEGRFWRTISILPNGRTLGAAIRLADSMDSARAHGVLLDVTDFAAIDAAIASIEKEAGPMDVLVNNAGRSPQGMLAAVPSPSIARFVRCSRNASAAVARRSVPFSRMITIWPSRAS
jgi:NAD(P)-dependent dehydrogenase (short-subunit alcohol dehydrogenase family)